MDSSEAPFERWPIVGGVVAGPGDTLVIAMESGRTMQELEELRDEIRRHISGGIRVAVIEGATGLAVVRPGDRDTGRRIMTDDHLAEVVRIYRDAERQGRPPTRAVATHFDRPHSTAARWVGNARRRGLLPAKTAG